MTHPFRDLKIKTYAPDNLGEPYIAYIGGVGRTAVHFTGDSTEEAYNKAHEFQWQAINQHEAALIAQKEAAKKRKAKAA